MLDQKWLDLGLNTSYEIPSGSAVAHGGNPQDPYGFASRFKSGNPPNALAHCAASPKSKLRFQRIKRCD
ncbi:MAG: hypothetical protein V7K18_23370 [Nostoc sp.]|uniref:hypothetical protein n=1 Tax=Nostoc sp. TaxID=1180 RepID=UPI002FFCD04E